MDLKQNSNRKIRVLFDTYHLSESHTGIGTYTRELYHALSELPRLEVICVPNSIAQKPSIRSRASLIDKMSKHLRFIFWKQVGLIRAFRNAKADALICTDYIVPYFGRFLKLPVIHDDFFWRLKKNYNPIWRWYYTAMVEKALNSASVFGITTSNHAKGMLYDHLRPENELTVIYQTYNHQLFKLKLGSESIPFDYFLHVGYFDKRKNIPVLIEAFACFKSETKSKTKLVLIGSSGLSTALDDSDVIHQVISKHELEDEVILTGHLSKEELKRYYSEAKCYVFPSMDEGFGIPVLEAMYMRLPIIISDHPALREVAGDGVLTFPMGDVTELSKLLCLLDSDIEERDRLIAYGEERIKGFTRANFGRQFEKMLLAYV